MATRNDHIGRIGPIERRSDQRMSEPRRPRRMSATEIERLATIDAASPMAKGAIRSMLRRADDTTDPARPFAEMLLAVPERQAPEPAATNPTRRLRPIPSSTPRRSLSPADLAWIERLPAEPADVPAADVATLAEMLQLADSASDRRLLERVFGPIKAHHDRAEAQAELDARQATPALAHRNRGMEQLAREALAARLREERQAERERLASRIQEAAGRRDLALVAQLQEERDALVELARPEANRQATERLQSLWDGATQAHEAEVARARQRLADLEAGPHPETTPHDDLLAARDRARSDDRPARSPRDYAKVIG